MVDMSIDTTLRYPCKECDNDTLWVIPDYPHVAECTECGHPNDTPDARQVQDYAIAIGIYPTGDEQ